MKTFLRLTFVSVLAVFILWGDAYAQLLHCDNLQQLVKIAVSDSTLSSIKGAAWDDSKSNYNTSLSLWDVIDDTHFQEISFNSARHRFSYVGQLINEGDGKKEFNEIAKIMQSCLTGNWRMEVISSGYPVKYRFRNPGNNVVLDLFNSLGVVNIICYRNAKK
jgi:hypothetical protein